MIDDDGKLWRHWSNKRVNARKEKIGFHLTFEEYVQLLRDAGLKSSDIGIKKYHLSRPKDRGDYIVGNCSFVPYLKNLREKVISKKSRQASRRNILKALSSRSRRERIRIAKIAGTASAKVSSPHPLLGTKLFMDRKRKLHASNIDLGSWGANEKLGALWGVTPQYAARFLKRYKDNLRVA